MVLLIVSGLISLLQPFLVHLRSQPDFDLMAAGCSLQPVHFPVIPLIMEGDHKLAEGGIVSICVVLALKKAFDLKAAFLKGIRMSLFQIDPRDCICDHSLRKSALRNVERRDPGDFLC